MYLLSSSGIWGWLLDLGGLALLLLLLLNWVEGHRGVDLGCPLLEELVHLVVILGDHLGGSESTSSIPSGDLLLDMGLHEGGPVSSGQVGQLECKLGILDNGICQYVIVPVPDVVALLDHLRVPGDVRAAA